MDGWNRIVATNLFRTRISAAPHHHHHHERAPQHDDDDDHHHASSGLRVHQATSFSAPLLLTACQFAAVGIGFLLMWAVTADRPRKELSAAFNTLTKDWRWGGLTVCGAFSTFCLQSLMMPAKVMSLGAFASSRAVELPVASVLRGAILGAPMGKRAFGQAVLGFLGAWLVTFSYAEIGNCLCIFTENAVPLSGAALYLVYTMLLTAPAAQAVLEESAVRQMAISPLLVVALESLLALMLFVPILGFAHLAGWEDVGAGLVALGRSQEHRMLVIWLCVQMMILSGCRIGLTCLLDSFWTVAA